MSQLAQYRRPFWDTQPGYRFDPYGSTQLRSPNEPLIVVPQTLSEITGPAFGGAFVKQGDNDLTRIASADAIGERIIVSGRVLDENGRPVPDALIEIWQANAAGRYLHKRDQHDAPLDPNFSGEGRTVTDAQGRYQFKTIKPGAYPWGNHYNGWRPQHIHFSLFGRAYATRLVTQMYFPGDPLLEFDPIFQCVPDVKARNRLVATLDWETTVPEYALGYRFDIVLRGRNATPME
ncbi:protocatechuate 3,4-dioxygenase subunit beta [Achromobacter kerstersii]|jgi:protocatechuate 3,4-dioxygenase beta subunit|uniref:Protocatechuate 3,4-dioxygenase beta chain n=1 Tax=Achromobacter kerstersii TaxID=1353890 RepID=A0A6S7AK87_9BURK|nr:protocatechuate 3,4-dioxygenase subunit beta [Achromobacter kerstersii]CAB3731814.1 Protocatechuate 3,4-dioxygenase beta chain [Achromobacter kerstersii]CUJ69581.1 Protocatechuate 3%2C4-dioxygenase beta chain [Achromobacter kerstersii]